MKIVGQSRDHFTKPSILSTDNRFGTESADYRDLSQASVGAMVESRFNKIGENDSSSKSDSY